MPRSRTDAAISTTSDVLSRLKDLSDAVPVPFVKTAFSAASMIFDMLDTMRGNKGECARLRKHITEMLEMLVNLNPIAITLLSASAKKGSILEEFKSTLLSVEQRLKKITGRNVVVQFLQSKPTAKELSDCRQDIDDVTHKLRIYNDAKQYLREMAEDTGVIRVPWSHIERLRYLSSGVEEVNVHGAGPSGKALMKVYTQEEMFRDEVKWYLENKEPYLLQIFGVSESHSRTMWTALFHDPGCPAQAFLAETCRKESPYEATLKILDMFTEILESARYILKSGSGGCLFDTAEVNYHTSRNSIVLVDWTPSRAYPADSSPKTKTVIVWDSFVKLLTKSLTGDASQPGHVFGEHGPTGAVVSRAVKHLVHLLWNYRYQFKTSDVQGLLQHLIKAVRQLRYTVQDSSSVVQFNPLLQALLQYQPFSASICSMWDIYDDVDIEPGDFGYMHRDRETGRLAFQRITTLQELADQDLGVDRAVTAEIKRQKAPLVYQPASHPWTAEELPGGLTRYTLRLRDCGDTPKVGVKLGTDRASLNTRFEYPWPTIFHMAGRLEEYAVQYKIHVSDIMLIFKRGRAERYSHITFADHLRSPEERCQAMATAGFQNDLLYYFDTPDVRDGQLEGYWSTDPRPGNPLWPSTPDEPGTDWGWEHAEPDLGVNIEVSRKGTKMRMRYLHL